MGARLLSVEVHPFQGAPAFQAIHRQCPRIVTNADGCAGATQARRWRWQPSKSYVRFGHETQDRVRNTLDFWLAMNTFQGFVESFTAAKTPMLIVTCR